jgi:aspartate racemase
VSKVGLFDRALAAEGLEVVHPADGDALLGAIRRIKAEGPVAPARATVLKASEALLKDGAQVQLIACTEYSLMADAVAPGVRGIDTLDVLVEEIVAFARG